MGVIEPVRTIRKKSKAKEERRKNAEAWNDLWPWWDIVRFPTGFHRDWELLNIAEPHALFPRVVETLQWLRTGGWMETQRGIIH